MLSTEVYLENKGGIRGIRTLNHLLFLWQHAGVVCYKQKQLWTTLRFFSSQFFRVQWSVTSWNTNFSTFVHTTNHDYQLFQETEARTFSVDIWTRNCLGFGVPLFQRFWLCFFLKWNFTLPLLISYPSLLL